MLQVHLANCVELVGFKFFIGYNKLLKFAHADTNLLTGPEASDLLCNMLLG